MPEDAAGQAENMCKNVRLLVELVGGTVDDIIYMSIRMKDRDDRKYVDPHWLAMFPDPEDRPARHADQVDMGSSMLMQCQITAVLPK